MSAATLTGLRVLVTRPGNQAEDWANALVRNGLQPVLYPTIDVRPPPSWEQLDEALAHIDRYAWVLFTSASAVRYTLSRLPDPRVLCRAERRVAAVGRETQRALEDARVTVSVVPGTGTGISLAQALSDLKPGTRVLFPQALGGRTELRDALAAQGCTVDVVPASQTIALAPLPPLPGFDVATFASPSALRAFVAAHRTRILDGRPVVVVGPTTGATAQALGLVPEVADAPGIDAVLAAIARAVGRFPE